MHAETKPLIQKHSFLYTFEILCRDKKKEKISHCISSEILRSAHLAQTTMLIRVVFTLYVLTNSPVVNPTGNTLAIYVNKQVNIYWPWTNQCLLPTH